MRKQLYLSVVLLGASCGVRAEEAPPDRVNVPLTDPSRPAVVNASLMNGGITVTGYAGKEVIVEAHPRGLESRGTGLSVEEQDNQVNIGVREMNRTVDLVIQVPFNTSLKLKCLNDGNIQVDHVSGEIDANDLNGGVKLTNISGSAVAHSMNEDVTVTFDKVTPGKAMSFSTMNGDIDVSLPADTKARVKMKADNGEIYSDFEVRQEAGPAGTNVTDTGRKDGRFHVQFEKALYGSINGGGPEMQFTTFNGKIYVRKRK